MLCEQSFTTSPTQSKKALENVSLLQSPPSSSSYLLTPTNTVSPLKRPIHTPSTKRRLDFSKDTVITTPVPIFRASQSLFGTPSSTSSASNLATPPQTISIAAPSPFSSPILKSTFPLSSPFSSPSGSSISSCSSPLAHLQGSPSFSSFPSTPSHLPVPDFKLVDSAIERSPSRQSVQGRSCPRTPISRAKRKYMSSGVSHVDSTFFHFAHPYLVDSIENLPQDLLLNTQRLHPSEWQPDLPLNVRSTDFIWDGRVGSGTFGEVWRVRLRSGPRFRSDTLTDLLSSSPASAACINSPSQSPRKTKLAYHDIYQSDELKSSIFAIKKTAAPQNSAQKNLFLRQVRALYDLTLCCDSSNRKRTRFDSQQSPHANNRNLTATNAKEKLIFNWPLHILPHYAVWQEDDYIYSLTDYCLQGDLSDFFSAGNAIEHRTESDVWRLLYQIGQALLILSNIHWVHCDVTTNNVFVDENSDFLLGDLGLLVKSDEWDGKDSEEAEGDGRFVAPEILLGIPPSAASDVYMLGTTAFDSITGRLFKRKDLVIINALADQPVSILAENVTEDSSVCLTTAFSQQASGCSKRLFDQIAPFQSLNPSIRNANTPPTTLPLRSISLDFAHTYFPVSETLKELLRSMTSYSPALRPSLQNIISIASANLN